MNVTLLPVLTPRTVPCSLSPIMPDHTFALDFAYADHRRVAFLLMSLDNQEPGDSWLRARWVGGG